MSLRGGCEQARLLVPVPVPADAGDVMHDDEAQDQRRESQYA